MRRPGHARGRVVIVSIHPSRAMIVSHPQVTCHRDFSPVSGFLSVSGLLSATQTAANSHIADPHRRLSHRLRPSMALR